MVERNPESVNQSRNEDNFEFYNRKQAQLLVARLSPWLTANETDI